MTVPANSVSPGRLLIAGRYLAVLDGTRAGAYVSTDGGRTFGSRSGRTGSPIAAVPTGLVADLGTAASASSTRRPACGDHCGRSRCRTSARSSRSAARSTRSPGQGTALVVAASRDAGRSWRRTTVLRVPYRTPELALVAGRGRRGVPGGDPAAAGRRTGRGPGLAQPRPRLGPAGRLLHVDRQHAEVHHRGRRAERRHPAGGRDGRRPARLRHRPVGQLPTAGRRGRRPAAGSRPCCAAAGTRSRRSPPTAATC